MPDPFNATRALRRLFPGKWYDLSTGPREVNRLISWICPACKPVVYDEASWLDTTWFPDPSGVATRLIDVFSYTDTAGKQYKLISFNHSVYDPDTEGLPEELKGKIKGSRHGKFTITHVFTYSAKEGY